MPQMWYPKGRITDAVVEAFVQHDSQLQQHALLPKLKALNVRACTDLTARSLRHLLRACPNLQKFTATRWSDAASLMDLTSVKHLHTLVLGDAEMDLLSVDDAALCVVSQCPSLTSLSLQRCAMVTDAGIATLAALPQLSHLSISGTRVTGSTLSSLKSLRTLDASYCDRLGDVALAALAASCDKLTTVQLQGTRCTNGGLVALQQLPYLSHLHLGNLFELTDEGMQALGRCKSITSLTFGAFNITAPSHEGSFPALKCVQFGGSYLNRGMRYAFPLGPAVEKVVASGFDTVMDMSLGFMARQHSLTTLELHGGYHLTPSGIKVLRQLPRLQHLTLVTCPSITGNHIRWLLHECHSLQHVTLRQSAWEALDACQRLNKPLAAVEPSEAFMQVALAATCCA